MGTLNYLTQQGLNAVVRESRLEVWPASRLTDELRTWIRQNRDVLIQEASNQGGDVQSVWYVAVHGKVFPMIRPGGMTRAQAEESARARWPDATVLAEEPQSGA